VQVGQVLRCTAAAAALCLMTRRFLLHAASHPMSPPPYVSFPALPSPQEGVTVRRDSTCGLRFTEIDQDDTRIRRRRAVGECDVAGCEHWACLRCAGVKAGYSSDWVCGCAQCGTGLGSAARPHTAGGLVAAGEAGARGSAEADSGEAKGLVAGRGAVVMRDGEDHRRGAESGKMDANGEMGGGDKEAMAEAMAEEALPPKKKMRMKVLDEATPHPLDRQREGESASFPHGALPRRRRVLSLAAPHRRRRRPPPPPPLCTPHRRRRTGRRGCPRRPRQPPRRSSASRRRPIGPHSSRWKT